MHDARNTDVMYFLIKKKKKKKKKKNMLTLYFKLYVEYKYFVFLFKF